MGTGGANGTDASADDLRDFARGGAGSVARLPNRFLASPDLYGRRRTEVDHSINFITAHDGFTLNDLVSYDRKHNQANGENNRDGSDWERSWNHGVEGPTDDVDIERLRLRVIKSLLAALLLSVGCPMLSMGDEVRRTQGGNNNAYCQDNETSWFDWSLVASNADLLRFVKAVITVRMGLDLTTFRHGLSLREFVERLQVQFHGVRLHQPDWSDASHSLAMTLKGIWWKPAGPRHPQRLARGAALPTPAGRSGSPVAADHRHRPRPARRRCGP